MSRRAQELEDPRVGPLALVLLCAALLFGGASQQNPLRLALVELISVPVLLVAGASLARADGWRAYRLPLVVMAAILAVPLIQLIPLPPGIWTRLPQRGQLATALGLVGLRQPWLPASLTPEATWRSVLALLPPLAMALAVFRCSERQRYRLAIAVLILAMLSLLLGAAQVASGQDSPLYLYDPANFGLPIGLFSNRNHQASFLLCALPIAALAVVDPPNIGRARLPPSLGMALVGLLAIGVIATRSRAGLILLGPVLAASFALTWKRARFGVGPRAVAAAAAIMAAVTLIAARFLIVNVLPRFDLNQAPEVRFDAWPRVLATALTYLPTGSGVGSFDPVYRSIEPLSAMQAAFLNHAHNDYLELLLETGWLGVAVLVLFLAWFAQAAVRAWTDDAASRAGALRIAGTVAGLVLIAHSGVDYPIRTEALAVLMALACGLITAQPLAVAGPVRVVSIDVRNPNGGRIGVYEGPPNVEPAHRSI